MIIKEFGCFQKVAERHSEDFRQRGDIIRFAFWKYQSGCCVEESKVKFGDKKGSSCNRPVRKLISSVPRQSILLTHTAQSREYPVSDLSHTLYFILFNKKTECKTASHHY